VIPAKLLTAQLSRFRRPFRLAVYTTSGISASLTATCADGLSMCRRELSCAGVLRSAASGWARGGALFEAGEGSRSSHQVALVCDVDGDTMMSAEALAPCGAVTELCSRSGEQLTSEARFPVAVDQKVSICTVHGLACLFVVPYSYNI
jgi:hypothetical protein